MHFFFLNVLISPSTCIAAVCSQYIFLIFVDLFHLSSTWKLCDYLIMSYSVKYLGVVHTAQMYLFLYFQSWFNYRSKGVDCNCFYLFSPLCSSAISGLILFLTHIMMILKKYFGDITPKTDHSMQFTLCCPGFFGSAVNIDLEMTGGI